MNDYFKKTYVLDAGLSRVFEMWLSEAITIPPVTSVKVQPVIGGDYKLSADINGRTLKMNGIFQEIIIDEKLVYSWEWGKSGNISLVTVVFSSENDKTRIELLHEGFQNKTIADKHAEGWDNYVSGLKTYL